jgi:hypothetical protein
VVRTKNYENIRDITEIVYDHVFFVSCVTRKASVYCKKISDKMPEEGAPFANLSFWIIVLFWLVK